MNRYLLLFFMSIFSILLGDSFGASLIPTSTLLKQSEQLIIVYTSDWSATNGNMLHYQRDKKGQQWIRIGDAIPVVIGKSGAAWGVEFDNYRMSGPRKQEGDNRTPVGVYRIGPAFGFDQADSHMKLTYTSLTDTSICVDDVKSVYYNQLIDSATIKNPDWHSGEKMRQVPQYQLGSVIQYNAHPPIKGRGSCIFMHIWKGPTNGTAGCVAMEQHSLTDLLYWLNPSKKPVILVLPKPVFDVLNKSWRLPRPE